MASKEKEPLRFAAFGKIQELAVVGQLLKHKFDVYMTVVDDKGIDCVVRLGGRTPRYLDIQVKARSENAKIPGGFGVGRFKSRPNLFFVFYSEKAGKHWVMPSRVVAEHANWVKNGKFAGRGYIKLTNGSGEPMSCF